MTAREPGLLAEFVTAPALVQAVDRAHEAGYWRCESFAPFAVPGLDTRALARPSAIPAIMLAAGAMGAAGGFLLQWWAASDYPVDVGGRPVFSWPAFVPITFELGVLSAVLVGIAAFLLKAGLPRYHHPAFSAPAFARASTDRFFLFLPADDPAFTPARARVFLAGLNPESITEVGP